MKRIVSVAVILLLSSQIFAAASISDLKSWHNMLIKFYGYQRAGLKSGTCYNLNSGWSGASHNGDNYNNNPLDGGWYDAGDYVKFGMNLGYSVYCLLKGYDIFPSAYDNNYAWNYTGTDQIPDILNEVKFATDYMIKAVINDNTIVLDVGNAQSEHNEGMSRANDPDGRSATEIHMCTGADIPATYAACLALMATLYGKYDSAYAVTCVQKAKIAYNFALNKYNGNNYYSDAQKDNNNNYFYYYYDPNSDGNYMRQIEDRLVAAGVELYRATKNGDPNYLVWAKKGIKENFNCMGYSFIGPLASFEVWRQGIGGSDGLSANLGFVNKQIKTSGAFKNVYQNSGWGAACDVGSAAFELAMGYVLNANETTRQDLKTKVQNHVDWITGGNVGQTNPRSYVCGINGGPTGIHYRSSNQTAIPGAVVSGPDGDGKWQDGGSNYKYTEVAINYNAGLVGAVAFLKALNDPGDAIQIKSAFDANVTEADFTSKQVAFSGQFSKSCSWTVTINGEGGTKTIKGTGTTINASWDGSADAGLFLAGETVRACLSIDGGSIIAYDLVKANPVNITITKAKKPGAVDGDVLVDDFEDNDLSNKVKGNWITYGTGTGMKATKANVITDDNYKSAAMMIDANVSTNDHKNFAGVKSTFNATGASADIGNPVSIAFDLYGSKATLVSVELEQSTITDSAYYRMVVPVETTPNSYRLNISDFKQPDSKKAEKALDFKSITGLRFTMYDSTGIIKLYLDNVIINKLNSATKSISSKLIHSYIKPKIVNGSLVCNASWNTKGDYDMSIYNMAGKLVMKRSFSVSGGKPISVSISHLPKGMYTVVNSVNGKILGEKFTIAYTK